jgi:hypothetical protein
MKRFTLVTATDNTKLSVRCALVGMDDLTPMLREVTAVEPRRRGGRATTDMEAVAKLLQKLANLNRHYSDDDLVERLKRSIATKLDSICLKGGLHPLAGLSPDGSTLILVFTDNPVTLEEPL